MRCVHGNPINTLDPPLAIVAGATFYELTTAKQTPQRQPEQLLMTSQFGSHVE